MTYHVHQIRTSWGQAKCSQGLYLDKSAQWLLTKLEKIGISGSFLTMFQSYLSNRKQCIVIDGIRSDLLGIQAGVTHGS